MHPSVMAYVAEMVDKFDLAERAVLEVGSYDENGSVRSLFRGRYTGVDVREGPGVDRVADGNNLPQLAESADVVVSTETLEHDLRPWKTVAEIRRVLTHGGTAVLTARGFDEHGCYPLHGPPAHGDYWRFTLDGLTAMVADAGLEVIDARPDPTDPGVFVTARKP